MKKLMAVAVLLLAGLVPAKAQVTYPQSNVPFVCSAVGYRPVTSLYQFTCRGLYFNNHDIEFFFYGGNRVEFSQASTGVSGIGTFAETSFTLPNTSTNPVTPGTFAFTWSFTDAQGVVHTGSNAGTWLDFKNPNGQYQPELLTESITVN
jgi:hypothetical protein